MPQTIRIAWLVLVVATARPLVARADDIPDDFPRFLVPGHQRQMDTLRALFWQHYQRPGPFCTIWDQWIPEAVLWPATSRRDAIAGAWAATLLGRPMDDDGYVATQQH